MHFLPVFSDSNFVIRAGRSYAKTSGGCNRAVARWSLHENQLSQVAMRHSVFHFLNLQWCTETLFLVLLTMHLLSYETVPNAVQN
jgi:hypothetical protein